MASTVDARLLKATKFPPEFNVKVDMQKVNLEVMKRWIAGKISKILGNEDDVVIELCFNLIDAQRYPDIKKIQIELTGFLEKDTASFCKELWKLCLSAQDSPQGVPKELLEAKKQELLQEKIEAEKAAEEARRQRENDQRRDREMDSVRHRDRGEQNDRGRGRGDTWRGGRGDRGGRDFDRRGPPLRSRSPAPRRRDSRDRGTFRDRLSSRERENNEYPPRDARRREVLRRKSPSPSVSPSKSATRSVSRSPAARRSRSLTRSSSPRPRARRQHSASRSRSKTHRRRSPIRSRSPHPRRKALSISRSPSPDRRRNHTGRGGQDRGSRHRLYNRSISRSRSPPRRKRARSTTRSRSPIARSYKRRARRISSSRSRSPSRDGRLTRRSYSRDRSLTPPTRRRRHRSSSRSRSGSGDKYQKRRSSKPTAANHRRNTSSVSLRSGQPKIVDGTEGEDARPDPDHVMTAKTITDTDVLGSSKDSHPRISQ